MRIAYVTCVYPPYPGGIGVAAQGMAQQMKTRGFEIEIFTPQYHGRPVGEDDSPGIPVHYLKPLFRYGNAALLPQLISSLKSFDIVHLFYPFFGAAELLPFIRRNTKAKIIVHHMMDALAQGVMGRIFSLHHRLLVPKILRQADVIITLSEDYFRNCDITEVYSHFDNAPIIEFVPNGVDTSLFKPKAKKEVSSAKSQVSTILFVGGLDRAHYFKGVHVLIEALARLKQRKIDFVCKLAGEGNMRKEYETHAQGAGLASQIKFLGLLPHTELTAFYQEALVTVVPSISPVECFSIVAAESQACGTPAIVTNFPGVRVTVENGVTGYVVAPGDPEELYNTLALVLHDPGQARTMGAAGRARVEKLYSWTIVGDALQRIYENLCHK